MAFTGDLKLGKIQMPRQHLEFYHTKSDSTYLLGILTFSK